MNKTISSFIVAVFSTFSLTVFAQKIAPLPTPAPSTSQAPSPKRFKITRVPRNRVIGHNEAYQKREIVGGHMNLKITPPEKRGKAGRIAVEVYNYSPIYLASVDFWMELENSGMYKIESHVKVEDMRQNWGDIVWIEIPRSYVADFPLITGIKITNLKMFDDKARQVKIPVTTDLIKY